MAMGLGFRMSKEAAGSHAVSFFLGAALPTALLFFLASDRLGGGFPTISSSWRGNGSISTAPRAAGAAKPATDTLAAGSDGRAAPTQDHEVRRRKLRPYPILSSLVPAARAQCFLFSSSSSLLGQ